MIEILYEDNHLLIVLKPINIPVQEDESKDDDLLSILKRDIKKRYNKPGNVYLGLVHRLDRPVSGVMVFAKTSKAAARLSEQIRTHQFEKTYYAVICNNKLPLKGTLIDKLYKDTKNNQVIVSDNGKKAILDYEIVKTINQLSLVKINLQTGRSHQIRVQFASRNCPLYGDQRYNENVNKKEQIALFSSLLSIYHPITKEKLTFSYPLPKTYPWSLFDK